MRHPGCQVILVIEQHQVEHLHGDALAHKRIDVAMRYQVVHQVTAGGAAGEDTDRSVVVRGVVPGILKSVPGGLQEQPLLGVHHSRGVRVDPEVLRVELLNPLQQWCAPDVGGISQCRSAYSRGGERLLRQRFNGLGTSAQVLPELRHRTRAGEAARHSYDGNRVGWQLIQIRSLGT